MFTLFAADGQHPITFSYSNLDKPFAKERIFAFRTNPNFPYTDEVIVDEIEIPGHDGVLIPVSVIHKKDVKLNSENTAYVYSYGAYGISSSAGFNPNFLMLAHKRYCKLRLPMYVVVAKKAKTGTSVATNKASPIPGKI